MAGQPLKFQNLEALQEKIKEYTLKCENRTKTIVTKDGEVREIPFPAPKTITGLARALGTCRQTILNYERYAQDGTVPKEYLDTIRNFKLECQEDTECGAMDGRYNATFSIFSMKNNYGWKDQQNVNLGGQENNPVKHEVDVKITPDEAYRRLLNPVQSSDE